MRILLSVGGMRSDDDAARVVGRLASALAAEVSVIYVQPEAIKDYYGLKYRPSRITKDREKEHLDHIEWILKKEGVTNIRFIRKLGEPTREILRESEKGYQMVVTGYRGLEVVNKHFHGSVSEQVGEYAKIPVLVVKKNTGLDSFLVCTDGSDHAFEAEYCAGFIAKRTKSKVTLFAVAPEFAKLIKISENAVAKGKEFLKKEFDIDAETKVGVGDTVREIVKESGHYDIVFLGSRGLSKIKRLLMGHVSLEVMEKAHGNILVIRHCEAYERGSK